MQTDIFRGHTVRTEVKNNRVWFNLTDVHNALGAGKPADTVTRIDPKHVDTIDTLTKGGKQGMYYVSERGLVRVLLTSRSWRAVQFQDWADERVEQLLGGATVDAAGVVGGSDDEIVLRAVTVLQDRIAERDRELESARPKAAAYEEFLGAAGSVSVGDAAKLLRRCGIDTGERRLFSFLDGEAHWTSRNKLSRKRRIMQTAVESGLLEYKMCSYEHPVSGVRVVAEPQIRVTTKGLHKLRAMLLPPIDISELEVD